MCYEFWHHQDKHQQQECIAKRVRDMIEKAKAVPLVPKKAQRSATVTEKDIVPV